MESNIDPELESLLKEFDILSLGDTLGKNSISAELLWNLEVDHLKHMGVNLGDQLKYAKAKQVRDVKLKGKSL